MSLSALTQAQTDLDNQVTLPMAAADTYLTSGEYSSALTAYQAAGQAGATAVGPEIDLAGAPGVTQPITQKAWTINGTLAAITDTTVAGATQAQGLVQQMVALYQEAISRGMLALTRTGLVTVTAGPGGAHGVNGATVLVWALVLGSVGGIAWGLSQRPARKKRRR